MEELLRRKLIVCILFVLMQVAINCAQDSNVTSYENVDANTLLKLGQDFNKPLLTLIGTVINNLHKCTHWSVWSSCTALRPSNFGIKKRTRTCGVNSQQSLKGKTETDFSVCTGHCPEDYNTTPNDFCMKLYTVKQNQERAQKRCIDDGGSLVHMDSELKYSVVAEFHKEYSSEIFVDGHRKDVNSPWIKSDGSLVDFFKWGDNDPDNGPNDLCLIISSGGLLFDNTCTTARAFICEI